MIDDETQIIRLDKLPNLLKILHINWFSRVNQSLSDNDIELSEKYISAVGCQL